MSDDTAIVGICQLMCPESEIRERERAVLIHFFEQLESQPEAEERAYHHGKARGRGNNGYSAGQQRQRRFRESARADKSKTVKAFTRPAAGVKKNIPADLRPTPVLKKTVAYLLTNILVRTDRPFIDVYDFVFDRLRAVRQDMVIQRIADQAAILIYEAIVKFHLYAEYRFRCNAPRNYDPCINRKHLLDCLKTLLSLYGQNKYVGETRPFFEALYCISSPTSYEVISRAFAIRQQMYLNPIFEDALDMCMAIQQKNYYKYFQLVDVLPPLLSAYAVHQVDSLRMHAFRAMSVAYGVQTCKIPLEWIQELLGYPNAQKTEKDLRMIRCEISKNEENVKFVKFSKSWFDNVCEDLELSKEVKFTVLAGLDNIDLVACQHICPWGKNLL